MVLFYLLITNVHQMGRAVKFYLVMPHPSPLLKEKELPSEPLKHLT
jgi:hypothetical protein